MAYAERAYRYDAYPSAAQPRASRADVRAIRTGSRPSEDPRASLMVTAAKLAAVVLVLIAVLSFARIALTNATVNIMIESDTLSSEIATARSTGVSLEMEQSVLSSTSALNSAVKRLHMAAPGEVGAIALAPDVVVTDANGSLSLSSSVKSAVNNQR